MTELGWWPGLRFCGVSFVLSCHPAPVLQQVFVLDHSWRPPAQQGFFLDLPTQQKRKRQARESHPEGEVRVFPLTFSISTKVVPLRPAMGCFIPQLRADLASF
jgi:hypothetical protein